MHISHTQYVLHIHSKIIEILSMIRSNIVDKTFRTELTMTEVENTINVINRKLYTHHEIKH